MCPTLTVGSIFRHEMSTFLFICSTTSNLNNFKPQQLQTSTTPASEARPKRKEKKQNRRPEPRKHTKNPHIAPLFFRHYEIFETFWIAPKGPPLICFNILQHNGCQKIAKGPPFTFFGTVTLFKNLILKIFLGNFFMSPNGPLHFFFIFCNQLEFHKARRVPPFQF